MMNISSHIYMGSGREVFAFTWRRRIHRINPFIFL